MDQGAELPISMGGCRSVDAKGSLVAEGVTGEKLCLTLVGKRFNPKGFSPGLEVIEAKIGSEVLIAWVLIGFRGAKSLMMKIGS